MSKLLKVIVNTLLLLAILSAGALVIPPFAGITTLVSDGMGNTNISRGAVTYAKKTDTSSVATGDKILVDDNSGKYIYTIQSLDIAAGTASVKNVISGDTTEITVRATVSKVIITIPVIGFLSMAAQSREGIMIIGLAILFLVILFILSEVWKRDEEEDEEEEEEDEDEDDEKASEELRSRKKAALEEKKKREEQEMIEQLRAADQKTAEEEKQDEFEIPDLEEEETEQVSFNTVDLQNLVSSFQFSESFFGEHRFSGLFNQATVVPWNVECAFFGFYFPSNERYSLFLQLSQSDLNFFENCQHDVGQFLFVQKDWTDFRNETSQLP